jgi:hypothetical protein
VRMPKNRWMRRSNHDISQKHAPLVCSFVMISRANQILCLTRTFLKSRPPNTWTLQIVKNVHFSSCKEDISHDNDWHGTTLLRRELVETHNRGKQCQSWMDMLVVLLQHLHQRFCLVVRDCLQQILAVMCVKKIRPTLTITKQKEQSVSSLSVLFYTQRDSLTITRINTLEKSNLPRCE